MYDPVAGTPAGDACRWGLLFNEDPVRSAPTARILWQAGYDPSVLQVTAEKVSPSSSERFDLDELPVVPTILRTPQGREHVDISDGYRHLRLDVQKGTLLHGPVKLHYRLL